MLSPYGLVHALSLTLPGCGENTQAKKELENTLFGKESGPNNIEMFQTLSNAVVMESSQDVTMEEANSAWVSPSIQLLEDYIHALKVLFSAEVRKLESAGIVNSWVAKATHDKITSIVDDGTVAQASLILINALYFKGFWEKPFQKDRTMNRDFFLFDGTTMKSPFMYMSLDKGPALMVRGISSSSLSCQSIHLY